MSYLRIKSKLNGNVIDIKGASTASGALLDAYPQNNGDNQFWAFVSDPAGSGYFFIKSKLDGNVIGVQQTPPAPYTVEGIPLNAVPQKTSNYSDQLWQFVEDPAGSGYCFIVNQGYGTTVDIQGNSTAAGAALQSYPMKSSGTDNQLWQVVDGSFPATVQTVANPNLGSNTNYIFYGDCQALKETSVFIKITEDMVCKSIAPPTECKPQGTDQFGFSFQLNCYSAKGWKCAYQQYVIAFWKNSSNGFDVIYGVDNWPVSGHNLINNDFPVMCTLPTAVLPAGYQISMILTNSPSAPYSIQFASFSMYDDHGTKVGGETVTIASVPGADSSDLAPITAFELDVVGPVNGLIATLTSGSGFVTYSAFDPALQIFVPTGTSLEPACTETTSGTCETANTFYGVLPASASPTFTQSFEVSSARPAIVRRGTPRTSTKFFGR